MGCPGITKHTEKIVCTKHFTGDILITDPCYVCKDRDLSTMPKWENYSPYKGIADYPDYDGVQSEQFTLDYTRLEEAIKQWREDNPDDWIVCDYGDNMEALGIHTYMTHSTLYGDWSCTTYDKDTKKPIGEFCADAGLVSVFLMSEVIAYNPDMEEWVKNHPWCATVIPNFEGDVSFIIVHREGTYEEDTEYWKKGEPWTDDSLIVEGTGNVNFTTRQTGL